MTKEQAKFKIIGITDLSGGSYWRTEIPLKALQGKTILIDGQECVIEVSFAEVDMLNRILLEQWFIENDAIFYSWVVQHSAVELALWGDKHKCLIFQDFDDFLNKTDYATHPAYKTVELVEHIKQRCILQASIADMNIVATQPIMDSLLPFSDATLLSFNAAPLEDFNPQFKIEKKDNVDRKIGIGFIGSSSHMPDWYTLKGVIKKIASDVEIQKKCRFVIAGVIEGDREWNKVINMLSVHKNMEVVVEYQRPTESFLESYKNIDICLNPLIDSNFNKNKSALKLLECSLKNVVMITSPLYKDKELNGCFLAKKPTDYYDFIKFLIKDDNLQIYRNKFQEINLQDNLFEKKITELKNAVETIVNREKYAPKNLTVYGIMYDAEKQFTEYIPVLNTSTTNLHRFEYNVFIHKLDEIKQLPENQWIGMFSHKFPHKVGLSKKMMYKVFNENKTDNPDLISFTHNYWKSTKEYLDFSNSNHPKLKELLKKVCNHLNVEYSEDGKFVTYSNFFLLKRDSWVDYIENWVIPALNYMENEIWDEVNVDANYTSGLNKEDLKKYTGLDFYNYCSFILERLIIIYAINKQLKTKTI